MPELTEVLDYIQLASIAFLFWFIRTHVSERVKEQGKKYGEIDARLERLPDFVAVEKALHQVQADVELALRRTLDTESLYRSKRLDFLERQLAEFYWPLYLRLQKDNAVWEKILDRGRTDKVRRSIAQQIEKTFILPNHEEMVRIIETKIHLAESDSHLEELLLRYLRHVAVYRALRDSGIADRDPIAVGEPWPVELFPVVREHTKKLQRQYDDLIQEQSTDSARSTR